MYMEDRHTVERNVIDGCHLLGVYDGHGGCSMADVCAAKFPETLKRLYRQVRQLPSTGKRAAMTRRMRQDVLLKAVAELDESGKDDLSCGSTLCAALLDPRTRELTAVNVGDSRMVMRKNGSVFQLTQDHDIDFPGERSRIHDLGGFIMRDELGCERVMGVLNMTRSLGDWHLRPHVSAQPCVSQHALSDDPEDFLVIATDGLWDVISNSEACRIVLECLQATPPTKNPSRVLVDEGVRRGSTDNISVIVAYS